MVPRESVARLVTRRLRISARQRAQVVLEREPTGWTTRPREGETCMCPRSW